MNYQRIYENLMSSRLILKSDRSDKKRSGEYYEGHHIIPKCLGGLGNYKNYNHPNIVLLTIKEHLLAHKLLAFAHPNNHKILHAYYMMIGATKYNSNMRKKGLKVPKGLTMKGKIHKNESKEQISNSMKKYYKTHKHHGKFVMTSCIYCGYTNIRQIVHRNHNEKCKYRLESV